MSTLIHDDFILNNPTAKRLYHERAAQMPIIDFHNHLNPRDIYEDNCYDTLADIWLREDHYKWRAIRTNGFSERLITGDGDSYEKYLAWANTVQNCIGNPLYHWTHLELKRYFDIDLLLNPDTAHEIWDICNAKLKSPEYSIRNLLRMQKVETLCTTDDPADDLQWHKKLALEEDLGFQVLPTFRPENAMGIEKKDFPDYIERLGSSADKNITDLDSLLDALKNRLDYFVRIGCRVTDHSLEGNFYLPCSTTEANQIFQQRLSQAPLTTEQITKYKGYVLSALSREYAQQNLVMQLHIGAIRNNSTRLFHQLGADAGLDSLNDFNYAPQLSALLDSMDMTGELPRTILYYLNPKDAAMLAAMAGNFQSNEDGIRGKVQLGSAWWLCDHKNGMEHQLDTLSDTGLIATFIGMLTDSRSLLSFPRHEYFRRILCNKVGTWIENGEYPTDMDYLNELIENICYYNAKKFFNL